MAFEQLHGLRRSPSDITVPFVKPASFPQARRQLLGAARIARQLALLCRIGTN
jgi:hypothetical protein